MVVSISYGVDVTYIIKYIICLFVYCAYTMKSETTIFYVGTWQNVVSVFVRVGWSELYVYDWFMQMFLIILKCYRIKKSIW